MTNKLIILTVIAQLGALGAYAQSSNDGGAGNGTGNGTGTDTGGAQQNITDPNDETSAGDGEALGNGWSESLGTAMFSDSSRTTVRSPAELTTQWGTLSTEDREMLRRDCAAHSADASTGTTGAASGGTSDTTAGAATTTTGTTTGTTAGTTSGSGMMSVSAEQMKEICDTVTTLQ